MTNTEFAEIIAYITAGCGKPLTAESQVVYFDLLGDLPAETLRLAARRVLLEHKWATFPSVAELRQAAVDSTRGEVKELSAVEAWGLARRVAARIDLEVDGSAERAMTDLPPLVREAMRIFGLPSLCVSGGDDFDGNPRRVDPISVQAAQFVKIYEQIAARDRKAALMPPAVRKAIDEAGERQQIAGTVRQAIEGIGKAV